MYLLRFARMVVRVPSTSLRKMKEFVVKTMFGLVKECGIFVG